MSRKQQPATRQGDEKTLLHLNALLNAIQYLDDIIKLAGDKEITPSLITTHQLPPLDAKYGMNELRRHFQQLSQEKPQEPQAKGGPLPNYLKTCQIFKKLLETRVRVDWFTVRVDEKIHSADDYYQVIPFGCAFSIIAAKLYANYTNNQDMEICNVDDDFLVKVDHSNYGGLQTEQVVVMKGESFTSSAGARDTFRMGRVCYNCLQEKPQGYRNIHECLRDFILIGLNCRVYNKTQEALSTLGKDLIMESLSAFQNEFKSNFSYATIATGTAQEAIDLVEQQIKHKKE
ncbi:Conserved_hypothetical protein [Hexamita inflata]|uniref:Uncharacterized protein n=1 Tax=Hexamita inflata TaxID=28002 RepID=A0AA86R305_9EUKA|nr:Conserved hypothetical protein [Hexamita inflata]